MKLPTLATPFLASLLLCVLPAPRMAADTVNTFEFTASDSGSWSNSNNWTRIEGTGTVPTTTSDKVTLDGSSNTSRNLIVNTDDLHIGEMEYVADGTQTQRLIANSGSRTLKIDKLIKNGGYTLEIRNNTGSYTGTLTVEVADLYLNTSYIELGQNSSLGGFTVTGTSTIAGYLTLSGVAGDLVKLGHLDLSGDLILGGRGYSSGTISVSSLKGTGNVQVSTSSNHNGTAGTLLIDSTNATSTAFSGLLRNQNGSQDAVLTVRKAGSGTQILSRSGGHTYTGGTTIEEGVLAVTNSTNSGLGTGAVVVEAGGVLAGSGRIAPGTGNGITIETGGTIAPSAHLDTGVATLTLDAAATGEAALLTLNEGASFTFRLGANDTSDRIEFTGYQEGKLALFAGGISLNGLNVQEGRFELLKFDTITTSEIETLGQQLALGSGFEGYNAAFSWEENAILLTVQTIPEPRFTALLLLGAGALGIARLRRRASR